MCINISVSGTLVESFHKKRASVSTPTTRMTELTSITSLTPVTTSSFSCRTLSPNFSVKGALSKSGMKRNSRTNTRITLAIRRSLFSASMRASASASTYSRKLTTYNPFWTMTYPVLSHLTSSRIRTIKSCTCRNPSRAKSSFTKWRMSAQKFAGVWSIKLKLTNLEITMHSRGK